jgi:hypothetical protein
MPVNPGLLLHIEGAALLALSVFLYHYSRAPWWQFLVLFMVPDVSILGYLVNARVGAVTYNAVHSYAVPLLLSAYAVGFGKPEGLALMLIWIAHIGFDRMLGFGLKYQSGFKDTHLNPSRHAPQLSVTR